jgi:N4-gp56 family major capsid protein
MAVTTFATNDPLTNKLFAKRLAVESIHGTYVKRFMGTTANSLCQVRNETSKASGDRITIGLRVKLSGAGVQGGATLEGNEESIQFHDDAITIDKLRHATRVKAQGSIGQQRVPYSMREEALDLNSQWWMDRLDEWFAQQLCGNTGETNNGQDIRYTGLQATVAPDAAHTLRFTDTADDTALGAESTAGSLAALAHIDIAVERAKLTEPLIRPVRYNGGDWYVMFLHTISATNLRQDADTAGNWFDIQSKLIQGGETTGNNIFSGALGVYNQTILHEWPRITTGSVTTTEVTNVRRNVFCGAQAAWAAFGQGYSQSRFNWVEKLFDYDEELGVATGCIGGLKSSRFNSADFGKIVVPHRAPANTNLGAASP